MILPDQGVGGSALSLEAICRDLQGFTRKGNACPLNRDERDQREQLEIRMAIARPASALLTQVIDAHGGMTRWNEREKIEATIVSGGGFFPLKGVIQDSAPRRMTVWLHEERSSVLPYGAPDQRTMFTPDRIAIEKLDGTVVAERRDPRDSFAGHQMTHRGMLCTVPISMVKPYGPTSRPPFC